VQVGSIYRQRPPLTFHVSFDLRAEPLVDDTVMRPGHVLQPVGGGGGGSIGVVVTPGELDGFFRVWWPCPR
jgi:hypothetical protein